MEGECVGRQARVAAKLFGTDVLVGITWYTKIDHGINGLSSVLMSWKTFMQGRQVLGNGILKNCL